MSQENKNDVLYDIAIIGGGINGCGCAADASLRGLSVFLGDKGDLGSVLGAWGPAWMPGCAL